MALVYPVSGCIREFGRFGVADVGMFFYNIIKAIIYSCLLNKMCIRDSNMVLRGILAKILHGIDYFRAVLHLIENDQCLPWEDFLPAGKHQVLQDTADIFGSFKELFVILIFIEVEICCIFVISSSKFFEYPCFSYLTDTF